jgi:hypothetical protein
LSRCLTSELKPRVAAECLLDAQSYYGLSAFAIELNELTDDLVNVLPPTDSRLRPDQRALEEGRADAAEALKHKLEEAQRRRRQEWASYSSSSDTSPRPPQFFEPDGESDVDDDEKTRSADSSQWRYKGNYFSQREKGAWSPLNIFDISSSSSSSSSSAA